MGEQTRAQLIAQGAALAGRTDSGVLSESIKWLNDWLGSQYQAWPWPFLMQRRSSLAIVAGVQSILVGQGNSGITAAVKKVEDSFFLRSSTYGTRQRPRLVSWRDATVDTDPDMQNTLTQRGPPQRIQVRAGTSPAYGVWQLIFDPVPDQTYYLSFDYQFIPDALAADSDVPLYPNDRTMVQAVATAVLKFANGTDDPSYQAALSELGGMAIDDRVKSGQIPGTNDTWGLDGGVFR